MLYAKLHAPPEPPLDAARKFVRSYFNEPDEDPEKEIARLSAVNARSILAGLAGIEALLADPPTGPYVLQNLVWWEAGQEEDGLTEESAVAWLQKVAEMVREVLGDKQPPRLGGPANSDDKREVP